jgi:hypothetical protein
LSAAAGRLDKAGVFGLEQNLAHRGPRCAEPRADIGAGKAGIKTLSRARLALAHNLLERVQISAEEELVVRLTFEQID